MFIDKLVKWFRPDLRGARGGPEHLMKAAALKEPRHKFEGSDSDAIEDGTAVKGKLIQKNDLEGK